MIKTIFAQETAEAAHQQWEQVADALREKFPKLADMIDASREDVLAYLAFTKDHWAQIASTNPLERANKEIKRRATALAKLRHAVSHSPVKRLNRWPAQRTTASSGSKNGLG